MPELTGSSEGRLNARGTVWDTDEYAAGYTAGLSGEPERRESTFCRFQGWLDGDLERQVSNRVKGRSGPVLNEFVEEGLALYATGRLAYSHGFAFSRSRTEPWQLGWVDAEQEHRQESLSAAEG